MSSSNPSSRRGHFGRDDMTALLGGREEVLLSEALTRAPTTKRKQPNQKDKDISILSTAETAAYLRQKDASKKQQQSNKRLWRKGGNLPQHQRLLLEELERQQEQSFPNNESEDIAEEEENDTEFILRPRQPKRARVEESFPKHAKQPNPQETIHCGDEPQRKRSNDDSDDSSGGSGSEIRAKRTRYRRRHDDTSSDDDLSVDDRRQRVLAKRRNMAKRRRQEAAVLVERKKSDEPTPAETSKENGNPSLWDEKTTKMQREDSSIESDDSSEEDDSSSSEDESSGSEEETIAVSKPLYVPKHKRNTIRSAQAKEEEEEERQKKRNELENRRRLESRAMVAQAVATSTTEVETTVEEEEMGGAANAPPDDTDPVYPAERESERDRWEVRELRRLLQTLDRKEEEKAARQEYERRRIMTDDERLAEDQALGLYRAPGQNRRRAPNKGEHHYLQRYFHRGAFYMDEEEWDGVGDIRHRSKEYERAATAEDKVDKRSLPKVMQVKKFGFARQNTRYKGLAKEDTTDRSMQLLPIVDYSKQSKEDGQHGRKHA